MSACFPFGFLNAEFPESADQNVFTVSKGLLDDLKQGSDDLGRSLFRQLNLNVNGACQVVFGYGQWSPLLWVTEKETGCVVNPHGMELWNTGWLGPVKALQASGEGL
jgi:hypothetical protein